MVSVVFAGQYDDLLAPPSSSPSPSSSSSSSSSSSLGSAYAEPEQMEMDHSAAPVQRRRTHQARHSRVENILRSPRNALNLSEKWLRWFDEGRFVIREWGGQVCGVLLFFALCGVTALDIVLMQFGLISFTYVASIPHSITTLPFQDRAWTRMILGNEDMVCGWTLVPHQFV